MNRFSERLKELREEKGLSQAALAKATGISNAAIGFWELNQREPKINALIVLADFFDVSLDYLVGRKKFE